MRGLFPLPLPESTDSRLEDPLTGNAADRGGPRSPPLPKGEGKNSSTPKNGRFFSPPFGPDRCGPRPPAVRTVRPRQGLAEEGIRPNQAVHRNSAMPITPTTQSNRPYTTSLREKPTTLPSGGPGVAASRIEFDVTEFRERGKVLKPWIVSKGRTG